MLLVRCSGILIGMAQTVGQPQPLPEPPVVLRLLASSPQPFPHPELCTARGWAAESHFPWILQLQSYPDTPKGQ